MFFFHHGCCSLKKKHGIHFPHVFGIFELYTLRMIQNNMNNDGKQILFIKLKEKNEDSVC